MSQCRSKMHFIGAKNPIEAINSNKINISLLAFAACA